MFTYKYLSFNTNYVFNRSTSPIRALSQPMENFGCVISTHFGVFVLLKNLLTSWTAVSWTCYFHWTTHRRRIQQPDTSNDVIPRQCWQFQKALYVHQWPWRRCKFFETKIYVFLALRWNVPYAYIYIFLSYLQLTPSMAIYDTMQSLQSPVGTHCVGYAYNLAGFLLAAGEKVTLSSPKIQCGRLYTLLFGRIIKSSTQPCLKITNIAIVWSK